MNDRVRKGLGFVIFITCSEMGLSGVLVEADSFSKEHVHYIGAGPRYAIGSASD